MTAAHTVPQRRPVICYVAKASPQHYKKLDLRLLRRHFTVLPHEYAYRAGNLREFLRKARSAELVFGWFASPWLALAARFLPRRTRLVVVAGGYDVANCRELRHGARFHPLQGRLTRGLLQRADAVLAVSEFNRGELVSWVAPRSHRTVYNAVDLPDFSLLEREPRKPKVLTVGIIGQFISKCKGHFRFLEVARLLPGYEFVLMGRATDSTVDTLRAEAPQNVRIVDYAGRDAMMMEMFSASVYLQLSYYESFGVSVAEAVACGCYPIVTAGTALTEVSCGQGDAVDGNAPRQVAEKIRAAVENRRYRTIDPQPVRAKYSARRREAALVETIRDQLADRR